MGLNEERRFLQEGIRKMPVFGFLRTSTDKQDLMNQRVAILDNANAKRFHVDSFLEVQMSTRKRDFAHTVHEKLTARGEGDTLVVSELSRLARDLEMLVSLVRQLADRKIRLISLNEGLDMNPSNGQDMQARIIVWLFSMLYEIERNMISERTKMGLARARAQGKRIGRPKGSLGSSKLDKYQEDIRRMLKAKVSYAAIGRLLGCRPSTVSTYVKRRGLE